MTTATDIKQAIRRKYAGFGCAVAFEVAHGTGRHANRHVDCVVFDLWPSRGLTLHAIEIKVSRSDLKRELAQGAKAEEVAQHCDLFSIAAPLGVVRAVDLPRAWGLIEMTADTLLKITKQPEKTKAKPLDRDFMAALVRAVGKAPLNDLAAERSKMHRELYDTFGKEVENRAKAMQPDAALWIALKDDIKADGKEWLWDDEVRKAVRHVVRSGALRTHEGLVGLEKQMNDMVVKLTKARQEAGL